MLLFVAPGLDSDAAPFDEQISSAGLRLNRRCVFELRLEAFHRFVLFARHHVLICRTLSDPQ